MWCRREKTGTALYDESGCNTDMTRRSPGCGSQRLLRCRSHPAGRGPNSSSLFPPLAAVVAVAPSEGRLWHSIKLRLFARGSPTRGAVERSETERLY